jgi:hypothetical protein
MPYEVIVTSGSIHTIDPTSESGRGRPVSTQASTKQEPMRTTASVATAHRLAS